MAITAAQDLPRVQRINRLFGWMGLGIQNTLLIVPFLLSLAGVYVIDAGAVEGVLYLWYLWMGFPLVTVFIAWLFVRAGAFRSGGRSWWGLLASCLTLLLWAVVFSFQVNGVGLGWRAGSHGLH